MDPQQRMILDCFSEALGAQHAYREPVRSTGVFVGVSQLDYARIAYSTGSALNTYYATGAHLSVTSGGWKRGWRAINSPNRSSHEGVHVARSQYSPLPCATFLQPQPQTLPQLGPFPLSTLTYTTLPLQAASAILSGSRAPRSQWTLPAPPPSSPPTLLLGPWMLGSVSLRAAWASISRSFTPGHVPASGLACWRTMAAARRWMHLQVKSSRMVLAVLLLASLLNRMRLHLLHYLSLSLFSISGHQTLDLHITNSAL
jgi:hypothetical protein